MIYLFYALLALVATLFVTAVALAVGHVRAHVARQRLYSAPVGDPNQRLYATVLGEWRGWDLSFHPTPVPAIVGRSLVDATTPEIREPALTCHMLPAGCHPALVHGYREASAMGLV